MKEQTLVIIKPDGMKRALVGEILTRFEKVGLKIVAMKMVKASEALAGEHYIADEDWMEMVGRKTRENYEKKGLEMKRTNKEHGALIRSQLMDYMSMDPVMAFVLEGHGAVKLVRKIVGGTEPASATPGTIRGDYSFDSYQLADTSARPVQNLIHASGEVHEAEREIKVWFTEKEICSWNRLDEEFLYRKLE